MGISLCSCGLHCLTCFVRWVSWELIETRVWNLFNHGKAPHKNWKNEYYYKHEALGKTKHLSRWTWREKTHKNKTSLRSHTMGTFSESLRLCRIFLIWIFLMNLHNTPWKHLLYKWLMIFSCVFLLDWKFLTVDRKLICLYPWCLVQCLLYNRHSTNAHWFG